MLVLCYMGHALATAMSSLAQSPPSISSAAPHPPAARPPLAASKDEVASPQRIGVGSPDVVPIIYQFFDWGTDFQAEHPEYGPVGSIQFAMWEDVNPGPGEYNWNAVEKNLSKERGLKVTLPDGQVIPKPVVLQIMTHLSSHPNWTGVDFYDGTPRWVYDQIDQEGRFPPRPIVNGRKVGYTLEGCDKTAVLPMYDNTTWQNAHYAMVRAFGQRYGDDPQITAIFIDTGLDGETQAVKDWYCGWQHIYNTSVPGPVARGFDAFVLGAMDVYRQAFPNKSIYIMNAPGGGHIRTATAERAATYDPPIGIKHCGMHVDLGSHQGYGDYVGSWDMFRAYSMTLPIWLESPFGYGQDSIKYWSWLAGLHFHPDAIDIHPDYLRQTPPEILRWIVDHLHRTIQDTPSVWTVLRDREYERVDWHNAGTSGHMGDWIFWLTRRDEPGGLTVRVWENELPAESRQQIYSRQARRTDQVRGNPYMYFDIDDGYPYVGQKPSLEPGGVVSYSVRAILLNRGNDTLALQYRDYRGDLASRVIQKGPHLGAENNWVTLVWEISDAYLNNNMGSATSDFRISSEGDGDEVIHLVEVSGRWTGPVTATPTPEGAFTPTPTLAPTPLPSETPIVPTRAHLPNSTPAPTRTPTVTTAGGPTGTPTKALAVTAPATEIPAEPSPTPTATGTATAEPTEKLTVTATPTPTATQAPAELSTSLPTPIMTRSAPATKAPTTMALLLPTLTATGAHGKPATATPRDTRTNGKPGGPSDTPTTTATPTEPASATPSVTQTPQTDASDMALALTPTPAVKEPSASAMIATYPPAPQPAAVIPTPTTWIAVASLTTVADAALDRNAPDQNYGSEERLPLGGAGARSPVLRFDMPPWATGAAIERAELKVRTSGIPGSVLRVRVLGLQQAWTESEITWNSEGAVRRTNNVGPTILEDNRSEVIDDSVVVEADGWCRWDITDLVQAWASGQLPNEGLALATENDEAEEDVYVMSREGQCAAVLEIYLRVAAPVDGGVANELLAQNR